MHSLAAGLLGLVVGGALVGMLGWLLLPGGGRPVRRNSEPLPRATLPAAASLADAVVASLHIGVVVTNSSADVLLANPAAEATGVVRRGRIVPAELRSVAAAVLRNGRSQESVCDLSAGRVGREPAAVRARVSRLPDSEDVLLVLEDITESRRVEAVRRDFVANVSHELKTPVGALSLLAEAVADACEEPAAVRRFAGRMGHEANRLGRLVQELIDLSRLQGADPLPEPVPVSVDRVLREAVDRTRLAAAAAQIEVRTGGEAAVRVLGSEAQLVTALVNLISNAIAYSPSHTRVALGVRRLEDTVDISVTDQGIGIAETDLERVFERFYRADPARSRATGGTGLGLAIVKHIATNHGGSVEVWSVERSGSTFTLRLPALPVGADDGAVPASSRGADPTAVAVEVRR